MQDKLHVLWIESRAYEPGEVLFKHTHPHSHCIYVVGGQGGILIDKTTYKLLPNHMYITPPGVIHSFWADENTKLVTKEIKAEAYGELFDLLVSITPETNCTGTPVYETLNRIHSERLTKKPLYKELSSCLFYEVLLLLERNDPHFKKPDTPDAYNRDPELSEDISKIKRYIDDNVNEHLTLRELSKVVNLEKTYFVKKFKSETGSSPMEYARNMKIKKAKKLLLYSDMSITQISEMLKFSSIHRFSEVFCKKVGISPREFRRNGEDS